MGRRHLVIIALVAVATGGVIACELNPQPLPPDELGASDFTDASTSPRSDAGGFGSLDAAVNEPTGTEAGADAADAADAGDAADAADGA